MEVSEYFCLMSVVYVQSLYSSLPRRCREVRIQKGDITKY